ncbi:anti-sigma factor [Flavobacterium sp.]|uniref:anti-sigma factor n=1 Tax=Flavobacterium sp. TaxID=239 RepID=UPI00262555D1|nr:anti-sigma factor [Flavobacterium sp.]
MSTNNLNQLFENQNNWDFEEPNFGHEKRFLDKLKKQQPKKKKINWLPLSIAASLLLGFGIVLFNYTNNQTEEVAFSPQVQETHDYFSSVINNELASLKKQETPQSKALITDAMKEMESLEKDYQNLKEEIAKNGENKQIVFAMITNMQTRISFIKSVLEQVENINNLKNETNENHS